MIRILFGFIFIFCLYYFGIQIFRELSRKEKWNLVKLLSYSAVCSVLTITTITLFVSIF